MNIVIVRTPNLGRLVDVAGLAPRDRKLLPGKRLQGGILRAAFGRNGFALARPHRSMMNLRWGRGALPLRSLENLQ